MTINAKPKDSRIDQTTRLAGGMGKFAATQDAEGLLRRAVMANLLWEDAAYQDGVSIAEAICKLVPQVSPAVVSMIAIEARHNQKLRHVPLLLVREMARHASHRSLVAVTLEKVIERADELAEFLALYWQDGKQPLAKQVKMGLAKAFGKFDAYQLAKYNRDKAIKLRDVLFMVHAKPPQGKEELFRQVVEDRLPVPNTWETMLSAGKDKKTTWESLITSRKLGALAFVRNLRNMESAKVSDAIIREGFQTINPQWLLPLNFITAAKHAPRYTRELEDFMLRGLVNTPKLPGYTLFVLDVSGSMTSRISSKSEIDRIEAGCAMMILAAEMCERVSLYATAGNDWNREHETVLLTPYRGFAIQAEVQKAQSRLGGGGIFTRQCLEWIRTQEQVQPDRIIIFSDSQDCDTGKALPQPFGKRNYIVDVSNHTRGINYRGVWDAEISGWSEHFLKFIAAYEGITVPEESGD